MGVFSKCFLPPKAARVDLMVNGGEVVSTTVDIIQRNPVLNMLWQHSLSEPGKPLQLKDDKNDVVTLLRHLAGQPVDLSHRELAELIKLFCSVHQYQCYRLLSDILREMERFQSPEYLLRIYKVLRPLPELPEIGDPDGPSAPPEIDLRDVDPEQDDFAAQLTRTYQRCLQVIDSRSSEVLSSDALLSLPLELLEELIQRPTLKARELDIGRGLLRWLRHHRFNSPTGRSDPGRALVLESLRLLTMSPKDLKKLELETENILSREELEAVLRLAHHGSGPLPPQLEEYRSYWQCPRDGGKAGRGLLKRLVGHTKGKGHGSHRGQDVTDSAERREAIRQKRNRSADKIKMALATGVSFVFD
ncbi:hypothetical protein FJT64_015814 [Amphibalanus amphitrite]|uniref:BACK domain-containing protein n=1 Tax=Amphibalanus amphitrite TaxID=1232801 RepID=A0A6A4X891_AMPAM|nr:hypothetical protein FJT64_015814 [Amphibalanus amphitrite]